MSGSFNFRGTYPPWKQKKLKLAVPPSFLSPSLSPMNWHIVKSPIKITPSTPLLRICIGVFESDFLAGPPIFDFLLRDSGRALRNRRKWPELSFAKCSIYLVHLPHSWAFSKWEGVEGWARALAARVEILTQIVRCGILWLSGVFSNLKTEFMSNFTHFSSAKCGDCGSVFIHGELYSICTVICGYSDTFPTGLNCSRII